MSSTERKPIILYDIACITPDRPWSPNTMKTRYCLGYKGLPFTTVWVELPDIAGLLQSKGITQPPYTLPAIEDPNTGTFIMDSLAIAAYLDTTYPETPQVLSPAAQAMLDQVGDVFSFGSAGGALASADVARRLVFLILAADRLNPVSTAYYHRTRATRLGELWTTLRDACAAGPEARAEHVREGVDALSGVWRKVTAMYEREGEGARSFVLGDEPCFLDFAVAGRVRFVLDGLLPSEMAMITNLDGGRLVKKMESLDKYLDAIRYGGIIYAPPSMMISI